MNRLFSILLTVIGCLTISHNAFAKLNIVTTLPNFAYLAQQIGGDLVEVKAMLGTGMDPHFIDAKPSFVSMISHADILISNGLDLEVGYLPILIDQANNPKIRFGESGNLVLGDFIKVLDVPSQAITREMGDVHPRGNPHYYLSPGNVPVMAEAITQKLKELDPAHANDYQTNLQNFKIRFAAKMKEWQSLMTPYKDNQVITYHKSLDYLVAWLGWTVAETIEPKAGVPPSSSRLSQLVEMSKTKKMNLILVESWYPTKDAKFLSEQTHIPILVIDGLTDDILSYFDHLFQEIVKNADSQ